MSEDRCDRCGHDELLHGSGPVKRGDRCRIMGCPCVGWKKQSVKGKKDATIASLRAEVERLTAAIKAERVRAEGLATCPCTIADKPCVNDCTCVVPYSSRGCKCCTRYGSDAQRKAAANRLVGLADRAEAWEAEARAARKALNQDAPPCLACGVVMVRSGDLSSCLNCGREGNWYADKTREWQAARARTDAMEAL